MDSPAIAAAARVLMLVAVIAGIAGGLILAGFLAAGFLAMGVAARSGRRARRAARDLAIYDEAADIRSRLVAPEQAPDFDSIIAHLGDVEDVASHLITLEES